MVSKRWKSYMVPNNTQQTREELMGYTLIQESLDSFSGNFQEQVVGIIIDANEDFVIVYLDPDIKVDRIEQIVIDSVKYHKEED